MKKGLLSIALLCVLGLSAHAQLSQGGLPLSMQYPAGDQYIPASVYKLPDWETAQAKSREDEAAGFSRPYLIGLFANTDISFPSSGTFTVLDNGKRIWRAQVKIAGAPAMGFYYDKFRLPSGVSCYLSNGNGQQILGAYTAKNNAEDGLFASEAVQGETVNIELNIDPMVSFSDIQLHIDRVLVYFRSIDYLNQYAGTVKEEQAKPTGDPDPYNLEGSSSTCEINALCPLGVNYPQQRKATIQILVPSGTGAGVCSATMINNTGNTASNCKQYLLTATHCDPANSMQNTHFSQLIVRFNFEKAQCTGGPAATVNTLTGTNFIARANYDDTPNPQINGDFMLLELKEKVPVSWDAYLAGWNRGTLAPALSYPKKYIGFHHPAADIKKVSSAQAISPNGEAGGSDGPGTHWEMLVDSGGVEQGSSGSALFDGDGRVIGIASVAGMDIAACSVNGKGGTALFMRGVAYSKLSYDWDYDNDGVDNFRKLKPWLDPTNSGVMTLDAVKSNCSAGTGIYQNTNSVLDNSISIYPNPVTNGKVTAKVNFPEATDLNVEVYNVAGARLATYNLSKVRTGAYTFDLAHYASGMYILKFSDGHSFSTKKVMLNN
jgi:hypothetical protein